MNSSVEVAVIGGGAAGIAAARKLAAHGVDYIIIEARSRLGGRAFTIHDKGHALDYALDLGCGWLHAADRNPWTGIATAQGRTFDKMLPPWARASMTDVMPLAVQDDFGREFEALSARLAVAARSGHDTAASAFLEPGNKMNGLLETVATFISGAEFGLMSTIDFERYDGGELDWRIVEGYGSVVATHAEGLRVALDCAVARIDHRGKTLRIETTQGVVEAEQAIVTLPTSILGARDDLFLPRLSDKTESARKLPLGLNDKLFIALDGADEFERESRVFGRWDRAGTAMYHFRPFGRPMIEAYFGGRCAHELEAGGDAAFFDFAVTELTGLFGNDIKRRLKPIVVHRWGADPFARGSYSYAAPGAADERAALAAPVDDRLFFAGEACSRFDFSTAHGAYITGNEAADRVIVARRKS